MQERTKHNLLETLGLLFLPLKLWRDFRSGKNSQIASASIRLVLILSTISLYFFLLITLDTKLTWYFDALICYGLTVLTSLIGGFFSTSATLKLAQLSSTAPVHTWRTQLAHVMRAAVTPTILLLLSITAIILAVHAHTTEKNIPHWVATFSKLFELFHTTSAIAISLTVPAVFLLLLTAYRYLSVKGGMGKENPFTFAKFLELVFFGINSAPKNTPDITSSGGADDNTPSLSRSSYENPVLIPDPAKPTKTGKPADTATTDEEEASKSSNSSNGSSTPPPTLPLTPPGTTTSFSNS